MSDLPTIRGSRLLTFWMTPPAEEDARPHYEPNQWDIADDVSDEENQEIANEALRRVGRVQRRYGHWYLAWLESLIRCSDFAASRRLDVESGK